MSEKIIWIIVGIIVLLLLLVLVIMYVLNYYNLYQKYSLFGITNTNVRDLSNCTQVQDYLKNHKVYVSLTTSPARIDKIIPVLDSLDKTYLDTIFLSIYLICRDNSEYIIPKKLLNYPKLKILRIQHDLVLLQN